MYFSRLKRLNCARHLNLSQKRLQPQLRNALALFIRVSSRFEFLAAHTNQGTYRYSSYNVVLLYSGIVSKAEIWISVCTFKPRHKRLQLRFNTSRMFMSQAIWTCCKKDFNPQLGNVLALFIRMSSKFEFLAAHSNQVSDTPPIMQFSFTTVFYRTLMCARHLNLSQKQLLTPIRKCFGVFGNVYLSTGQH